MSKSHRLYTLLEGKINNCNRCSCQEIAEHCGLPSTTIYSRLSRGVRNFEKLTEPVIKRVAKEKPKKKKPTPSDRILLEKPFYDPMFRLAMKSI